MGLCRSQTGSLRFHNEKGCRRKVGSVLLDYALRFIGNTDM